MTLDPTILSQTGGAWIHGVDLASRSSSTSRRPPAMTEVGEDEKVENGGLVGTDGEVFEQGEGEGGERGLWPTGYQKLVCATMK